MCDKSERKTGDDDEEIGYCQIGQEDVDNWIAHRPSATKHCNDDENVTDETSDKNKTVGDRKSCTCVDVVTIPRQFKSLIIVNERKVTSDVICDAAIIIRPTDDKVRLVIHPLVNSTLPQFYSNK